MIILADSIVHVLIKSSMFLVVVIIEKNIIVSRVS